MPRTTKALPVTGTVVRDSDGVMLVLSERLDGHDTFLTGQLELNQQISVRVRILTLDDMTMLRLTDEMSMPPATEVWTGVLHLPHGWRTGSIPEELTDAAALARRDLRALDSTELRYALTFLAEATTEQIGRGRINIVVSALPGIDRDGT